MKRSRLLGSASTPPSHTHTHIHTDNIPMVTAVCTHQNQRDLPSASNQLPSPYHHSEQVVCLLPPSPTLTVS